VAGHAAGRVEHRDAEVALGAERGQVGVAGKQPRQVGRMERLVALQHHAAGRGRGVVLEVVGEAGALPEGEGPGAAGGPRRALGEERVPHPQRGGQVADQGIEEVRAGDRRRPLGDLPEHALRAVELLVGRHVRDGQRHLAGRLLQERHVGRRVLARDGAGHGERADAPAARDQRHDDEGPHAVGVRGILGGVDSLGRQVVPEQRPLVPEDPAHVALVRGHLEAHGEVLGRERRLQDEQREDVPLRVVQEHGRPVEGHHAPEGPGDGAEQVLAGQVGDDRVVDLQERLVPRPLPRPVGRRTVALHDAQTMAAP
jgi:hypothetical protein